MGPKKIVAKQEVVVEPDINTSEMPSGKKTPVKRVAKPKQTKNTDIESNESYDTKLKDITERCKVYNKKSETLRAELENVDNETLKLLKELTIMLDKFNESNDNKSNDNTSNNNTFVLDKPSTSAKSSKKKAESSDSSNDKESSDNDTNSDDDDDDIKTKKAQPKTKSKTVTPAKPSRAKAKASVVPVLNVDDSDSDE